jgi:hypothetical protein
MNRVAFAHWPGWSRRLVIWVAVPIAVSVSGGCSDSELPIAPISGKVTLDGQPLADAVVRFQPLRTGDSINVGPPSTGRTDADGVYRLKVVARRGNGAVVGKHRVTISTLREEENEKGKTRIVIQERVPVQYNRSTTLMFEVPAEGTNKADFLLTSN